jgi:hypothetical protein
MTTSSWKQLKREIWIAIKQISDYYGGDDEQWLIKYYDEVIENNKGDLSKALDCFNDLVGQLKYASKPIGRDMECSI